MGSGDTMTTPICRCRVLYLGSAVPHITKDGLQGIQEPLRDLYPEQGSFSAKGIDSWLSVWSNGILLENVDESMRQVTRFFNIETLHYCAAIRYVMVPGNNGERVEKFLPLDSPFARYADPGHPPLFACILRRTTGIKVLECHAFICKKEAAANALVRCCFHSYADSMQAKQMDENPYYMENRRSQSLSGLNTLEKVEVWRSKGNGGSTLNGTHKGNGVKSSRNGVMDLSHEDDNYKIWTGIAPTEREMLYVDNTGTMRSLKSATGTLRSAQAKIRQMVGGGGMPRPPPPPSPSLFNGKDNHHHKKSSNKPSPSKPSKSKKKHPKELPQPPPQLIMNGGTSGRMKNGGGGGGMRPVSVMGHYMSVPPQMPPYRGGNAGYYTERRAPKNARVPVGYEEPIYISSSRPLSPVSTYQPAVFPYEQYFMQYGTAPRNMPAAFREGAPPVRGRNPHQQQHYYQPQSFHPPAAPEKHPPPPEEVPSDKDDDSKEGSPFNTGIYRRKGHLNERAFSYSIRQEHRSRSNSLASLQFFANSDSLGGGEGPERSRDEDRKERELAQLVNGLDLKDNGIPGGSTASRRGDSNFIKKKSAVYQR